MNLGFGKSEDSEQWAPISDLMAALMLIFMFIAIIFIRTVVTAENTYREECDKIYQVLTKEFGTNFEDWDVELLEDLTIRFRNPEVLFEANEAEIRPRFADILEDFFPRYMKIIHSEQYRSDVREIRIEGHTSSEWRGTPDEGEAYFLNMDLSQRRTREILYFIMDLPKLNEYIEWAKAHITANGLSSSRLILTAEGKEDRTRSRRVDFRLMTASCRKAGMYD